MVVDRPGHAWTKHEMRTIARVLERQGIGRSFQYIFSAKVRLHMYLADIRSQSSNL